MMRWLLYPLALVVVFCCLCALPALGQSALDPNDNFDDGVIDTSRWILDGDPKSAFQETGGQLTMAMMPTDFGELDLTATWWLRGPFDLQVDYSLLDWPAHSGAAVGLLVMSPDDRDWEWVERLNGRVEVGGTDEVYLSNVRSPEGCFCEGVTPTLDTTGTLRLTRDESSLFTAYYWSAASSEWVTLYQRTMPDTDARPRLTLWGPVAAPVTVAFDNFQVNRGEIVTTAPTIEDVVIDRGRDTDWWDWSRYHTRYTVQVKGTEYEQPACLLMEDMQGVRLVLPTYGNDGWHESAGTNAGGSSDFRVTAGPDFTYTYVWYEARQPHPIPEGSYRITVVGTAGSRSALTTPVFPAVPDEGPVLSGPAAESVIGTTVPTFEWLSLPGAVSTLQLRAEGVTTYTGPSPEEDDCGQIWRAPVTGQTSAVYNFDGTGPALDPGRTYFWQISDWYPVDDRVSDPRISLWNDQTARHRFTIDTTWPGLPDLPGRLAYEQTMYGADDPFNLQAILQYGTTPQERTWVGPDASHTPGYSWDGTKIAYRISDTEGCVANADGSDPVPVPGMLSWDGADLSPDATWITYISTEVMGVPPLNVYTQRLFEPARTLLVANRGINTSRPRWSPDGKWVAYLSCCDPSGNNVWMIHPDGTQDHPVVPTSLAGYPDWTVGWAGSSVGWSPDGVRLAVNFSASSPDGATSLDGIGVMSKDGGELTPVFVNPAGHACCAAASFLCWSPDGHSLVFSSTHHLPVDPDWANGGVVPGVELWLIDADGSGEPTRLTYDYSYAASAAWWAPNTLVGKGVSIVKGEATLTFAQVSAEGSTRMNVTGDVPGPAPEGYSFASDLWSGATTAGYQGDITVALQYDAGLAGREDALALVEWDPAKGKWQEITAHPIDAVNQIIRGRAKSLGVLAICLKTT